MDAKEIKRILKDAKDSIKNKDFKTAIKLCKSVLKEDRNNYVALVLFGASLQESGQLEEAPKAFKKACEVSPDLPLAWQGLISFFEKHGKNSNSVSEVDLLKAYSLLIPHETDLTKKVELSRKLGELAVKLQSPGECSSVLASLSNDETADEIRRCLVKALFQIKERSDTVNVVMEKALGCIVLQWKVSPTGKDYDIQEFYRQYLKQLYKFGERSKVFSEAKSMAETFSKDPYPFEWICKLWVEFVAEGKDVVSMRDSITNYIKCLEAISPASSAVNMAFGAMHFYDGDIMKAREELTKAVISKQVPWHVYLLLAECELKFGCPEEALTLLSDAKAIMKQISSEQEYFFLRCEANALSRSQCQEELERAVQLCQKLLTEKEEDNTLHLILAYACVSLKNFEEAEVHLRAIGSTGSNTAKTSLLQARIMHLSGHRDQAIYLLESVAPDLKDSEIWLDLSKLHDEAGKLEDVLTDLIQAARCDPYFWETFMLLGNYYRKMSAPASLDKARRCFQKALQLNPKSLKVGEHLSDVLLQLHDVDNNIQLLNMMTQSSNAKWIWLRLGLLFTERGEIDKAITHLCNAVRSDPLDCRIWESLGDAYMLRGAWFAAFKSFQKVMQLSPGNIYAAFQIGTVKLRMNEFEEALVAFRQLLEISNNYVPALQGQGEAAFCHAQVLRQEQRLGCARDRCQEAIDALTKVLDQRRDLSCTWKLLGDTCLLGARLPPFYANFHLAEWLVSPNTSSEGLETKRTVMLKKMDMFALAERMFCRAMSISQENSLLWHDLAATNFWHAMALPQSQKRSEILQRGLTAARRAVTLNHGNTSHWNILGVLAATEEIKQLAVAQHAFIQALCLDSSSVVAWTNLGTLYLIIGNVKLANKAFSAAQRGDHDYTNCWLGQAMIAESMAHPDTVDLFRHAASLEYHHESCSGYAHWVLTILLVREKMTKVEGSDQDMVLKDMKNMHAVEVAADCMRWYTERHLTDPCGWNMLGLLLERQRLFHGAQNAFQQGLDEALLQGFAPQTMDAIRCNLGRILTDQQNYEKAIETLKSVSQPSFASQSGLALAFFKAQKFEEAYGAYSTALEWLAPNEETRAFILMAMASMQYSFNQLEDCKTLLFQSIQPKPLSPYPLLALCSIGLLHQDIAMSKIMLKELSRFKDDPKYTAHIGLLGAYTSFLQGDLKGAVRSLSKAVHRHPGDGALWLSLAQVQMHAYPKCDATAIGRTANAALRLGRANMDISKVQAVVSVSHLLTGNGRAAALNSQKAVHQFPNVAENWSTLVASILPQSKSPKHAAWLCDLVGHVRRRLQPSSAGLKKWLGNCEHHLRSLASE